MSEITEAESSPIVASFGLLLVFGAIMGGGFLMFCAGLFIIGIS